LKTKQKTGNLTEKQAQHALAGKLAERKISKKIKIKIRVAKPKKQARNEQIFKRTRPICL